MRPRALPVSLLKVSGDVTRTNLLTFVTLKLEEQSGDNIAHAGADMYERSFLALT
jgi:hypothetical protein